MKIMSKKLGLIVAPVIALAVTGGVIFAAKEDPKPVQNNISTSEQLQEQQPVIQDQQEVVEQPAPQPTTTATPKPAPAPQPKSKEELKALAKQIVSTMGANAEGVITPYTPEQVEIQFYCFDQLLEKRKNWDVTELEMRGYLEAIQNSYNVICGAWTRHQTGSSRTLTGVPGL